MRILELFSGYGTASFALKRLGIKYELIGYSDINKWAPTLNCTQKEYLFSNPNELEIRKLTPKECFRLQGFLEDEIDLSGISNSQQYKLAGNGQTVTVVAKLFEQMFKNEGTN